MKPIEDCKTVNELSYWVNNLKAKVYSLQEGKIIGEFYNRYAESWEKIPEDRIRDKIGNKIKINYDWYDKRDCLFYDDIWEKYRKKTKRGNSIRKVWQEIKDAWMIFLIFGPLIIFLIICAIKGWI